MSDDARVQRIRSALGENALVPGTMSERAFEAFGDLDALAAEVEQLRERNQHLERELDLRGRIGLEMAAEVEQLRGERDEYITIAERLETDRDGLAAEVEQLREENANLREDLVRAQRSLKEALDDLEDSETGSVRCPF